MVSEGGKYTQIAAEDKDLPPLFEKLCKFATRGSFDLADLIGEVKPIYTDEEIDQLIEKHDDLREDHYLDAIFGMYSRL